MNPQDHIAQKLIEARSLIATPETWSQASGTFDGNGAPCPINDPKGVRFSAECAVGRVTDCAYTRQVIWEALNFTLCDWLERLGIEEPGSEFSMLRFNAESNHAMVLAIFDLTIARLQTHGP